MLSLRQTCQEVNRARVLHPLASTKFYLEKRERKLNYNLTANVRQKLGF